MSSQLYPYMLLLSFSSSSLGLFVRARVREWRKDGQSLFCKWESTARLFKLWRPLRSGNCDAGQPLGIMKWTPCRCDRDVNAGGMLSTGVSIQ